MQSALATELVNELYANVDVGAELQTRLPKNLKQLADPAAAALRDPATRGVEFLLSQPRFQKLFVQASDVAHEKLVNVLENKTGCRDLHRERGGDARRHRAAETDRRGARRAHRRAQQDPGRHRADRDPQIRPARHGAEVRQAGEDPERLAVRARVRALRGSRSTSPTAGGGGRSPTSAGGSSSSASSRSSRAA